MRMQIVTALLASAVPDPVPRPRQPSGLSLSPSGDRLFVANGKSGSVSVVQTSTLRIVSEDVLGREIRDLVSLPDGRRLVAVDQADHAALLLEATEEGPLRVLARRPVAADPVGVAVAPDGRSCVVASRWSRTLTFLDPHAPGLKVSRTLALPFSPLRLAYVRGGSRLVVADAFGGRLAVVDPDAGRLASVLDLPGQNIRGLAESPDHRTLVVAFQILRSLAHTSREDVHWGSLMSNELLLLDVGALLEPVEGGNPLDGCRTVGLGDTGNGAGDPSALAYAPAGRLAVALGGVDEVRFGNDPGRLRSRAAVGRQPDALAISRDSKTLHVANRLDGSLSVIDLETGRLRASVSLGPRPEPTAAERGERLFRDARLSHDGWLSCHSCHTDCHSRGGLSDTLGDGGFGAPKRIPSLLGTGRTGPWGWLGGFERLDDQVRASITSTMRGAKPSEAAVADLVAYLRSLEVPAPSATGDGGSVERGREVFRERGCAECHQPPLHTTPRAYDVGLTDEVGNTRFNPPSLLGVGRLERLLHDGRATTIEDVLIRHGHPRNSTLPPKDVEDLAAFLRTL